MKLKTYFVGLKRKKSQIIERHMFMVNNYVKIHIFKFVNSFRNNGCFTLDQPPFTRYTRVIVNLTGYVYFISLFTRKKNYDWEHKIQTIEHKKLNEKIIVIQTHIQPYLCLLNYCRDQMIFRRDIYFSFIAWALHCAEVLLIHFNLKIYTYT